MTPLWQFSVDFYQRPGVEAGCLSWQEQFGADVNVLMLCVWCATEGKLLDKVSLQCLLEDPRLSQWREGVVLPLRAARRVSKRITFGEDKGLVEGGSADFVAQCADCYQSLVAAELQSECVEQHFLWQWACTMPAGVKAGRLESIARQNLLLYGQLLSVPALSARHLAPFLGALNPGG
jgi:uncharacterized protein (TIGR02444 family)